MNLWLLLTIASLANDDPASGSVRGVVRTAETGAAIPSAHLRLVGVAPSWFHWSGVTNTTGEFRVDSLAAGPYRLTVTHIGREEREMDVIVESGASVDLIIALELKVYVMDPIVVSASRHEEKALESPSRVQVIDGEETRLRTTLTPADHLQGKSAVDVARTGLSQGMVVVRGFNNVFSGATLTLVDHRISHMPSLRYNAYDLIPASYDDIKQIEVVSGPGSALYGPNSANGVVHMQTLSAFDDAASRLTVAGGNRDVMMASGRYAQLFGDRTGLKVTAQYQQGEDFPYDDPAEEFPRDYDNERLAVEGRLDVRPKKDAQLIFSGGWNRIEAIEMTPLGATQAGVIYRYGQARTTWGDWFGQAYIAQNDTDDSFNLRTGDELVDTSMLVAGDVQRSFDISDRWQLMSGVDVMLTRPETEGTINGRNEGDDNIEEIGGYAHAQSELSDQWTLTMALRADKHSRLEDPVVSPRVAVMWEPAAGRKFRFSYNRAFSTPTTTNLFLDLLAGRDIFASAGLNGYDLRAEGVPDSGYRFQRDAIGGVDGLYMQVSEELGGSPQHIPADATLLWPFIQQLDPALAGIPAPSSDQVFSLLRTLDPSSGDFVATTPDEVRDIDPLRPTITNTLEAGVTTLFGDRLLVTADAYYSRIEDFVGPLRIETPNVFMDEASLREYLSGYVSPDTAAAIAAQVSRVPLGTVTPAGTLDPADLLLTYRNFGVVNLGGFDLALQFHLNPKYSVQLNYSFVSRDFFEDVEGGLDVALNAPQHKAGAGLEYRSLDGKAEAGVRVRFVDGFPVQSGVYVGHVDAYTLADLAATYEILPQTQIGITVQNLFDDLHQEFVGAPQLGRTALLRLTRTF